MDNSPYSFSSIAVTGLLGVLAGINLALKGIEHLSDWLRYTSSK